MAVSELLCESAAGLILSTISPEKLLNAPVEE
jgi:hypothetical protein